MSNPLFKSYLGKDISYLGGKAIDEIETRADKIYKLSSNENALGASPKAIAAIKAAADGIGLYPDRTDAKLTEALSDYYKNELSKENFLAANSGSECIEYIIKAFMGEGTNCITATPGFSLYRNLVEWVSGTTTEVKLLEPNFRIDIDGILSAITPETRVIFITSPNNPTGTYVRKSELDQLMANVPDHVVVVYDEVYYLFTDAEDYSTAVPYVQDGKQIIGLNSFSKSYGLAGLRLGYMYSTERIIKYMRGIVRPFLINALSLHGGIAALSDDAFIEDTVSTVQAGRAYMEAELKNMGITYWPSQGNFVLIQSPIPPQDLEAKLTWEGVMVRPVENFGAKGCVRVTVGTMEACQAFIAAMKKIL